MKNIVITILAILVLGLGGYLVYDKVIDKDVKEENNKEQSGKQEGQNYDLAEAKKLLDKYTLDYFMFTKSLFNDNMTESHKIVIAIHHTKNSDINYTCKDAFKDGKFDGDQFIIETDDFWGSCYDIEDSPHANKDIYSYENVNKTYKKLFGEKQDLPKQLVSFYTYRYAYSEKYDAYIGLSCECGIGGGMIDFHYGIDKAIETNEALEIFVNYVEFEYDGINKKVYVSKKYDINVDSPDEFGVSEEEIEKLYNRAVKELNKDQIKKYKFTFKKNDNGYYLESIINEVY